jgi:threonine/homoserine/homoserine lactone efflux protein
MEQLLGFAVVVIIISASGVMSPGPLFTANIFYGIKGGTKAGIKMAFGHTVVELPLIILLGVGALSLEVIPEFQTYIGIIGGVGLFTFAGIQLRQVFKQNIVPSIKTKNGPFLAGIFLSALNPFFIIWWVTIGFKLISDSLILWSFWGIGIMFLLHIWMDYAWLSTTAMISSRISKVLSNRNFKFLIAGLSMSLVYFGITFLIGAFV